MPTFPFDKKKSINFLQKKRICAANKDVIDALEIMQRKNLEQVRR